MGPKDFRSRIESAVLSSLFAGLTAALSYVAIPLPVSPVPVTGQTLGIMLAGLVLGPWWGAVSAGVYLAIGALGFPVFAGGRAGLGVLAGPTGGYLLGFVAGAWVTGLAASSRKPNLWTRVGAAILGGVGVVHLAGSLWLAEVTHRSLGQAFAIGSAPYIPGDLLKALASAAVAGRLRRIRRRY